MKKLFYLDERKNELENLIYISDNHDTMLVTDDSIKLTVANGYIQLKKSGRSFNFSETTKHGLVVELMATMYEDKKTIELETIVFL